MKNSHLEIAVNHDQLTITIGTETLLHALSQNNLFDGEIGSFKIINKELFLDSLISALTVEAEDGSTLVHRAFDKAALEVVESGCESVADVED